MGHFLHHLASGLKGVVLLAPRAGDGVFLVAYKVFIPLTADVVPETHSRQHHGGILVVVEGWVLFLCVFLRRHVMQVVSAHGGDVKGASAVRLDFKIVLALRADPPVLGKDGVIVLNLVVGFPADGGKLFVAWTIIRTLGPRPYQPVHHGVFHLCAGLCQASGSGDRHLPFPGVGPHHHPLHDLLVGEVRFVAPHKVQQLVRIPPEHPDQKGPPGILIVRVVPLCRGLHADPALRTCPCLSGPPCHGSPPYRFFFAGGIFTSPSR